MQLVGAHCSTDNIRRSPSLWYFYCVYSSVEKEIPYLWCLWNESPQLPWNGHGAQQHRILDYYITYALNSSIILLFTIVYYNQEESIDPRSVSQRGISVPEYKGWGTSQFCRHCHVNVTTTLLSGFEIAEILEYDRIDPLPLSGTTTASRNTLLTCSWMGVVIYASARDVLIKANFKTARSVRERG